MEEDAAEFMDDGEEQGPPPEPTLGNVRIVIKGAPAEPLVLDALVRLLLGSAIEGSDQLARRIKDWDVATDESRQRDLFGIARRDGCRTPSLRTAWLAVQSARPCPGSAFDGGGRVRLGLSPSLQLAQSGHEQPPDAPGPTPL